ncbi:PREDICTED: vomeronasal type-1 receptor 4-like [Lipotes vexillifer]|uniref:Vomeronasal type-1 receptor n=1 Tax=Lipotes vexillifer TaxID=118797 RepID=A0A340WRH9_LIPVE|nr:PREDICTED: vomeronasal type-1 receptor 4-like [Lipotes vexillifer]
MTILFRGIQDAMSSFGIWPIMGNIGCKSLLYIHRVTQGISLCTVSVLNTFQAIRISPRNSKRNFLCINLMIWTSGYMVMLLYNHHKTVQNLHGSSLSPRLSP